MKHLLCCSVIRLIHCPMASQRQGCQSHSQGLSLFQPGPPLALESAAVFSFHQGDPCSLLSPSCCANWNRLGRRGGSAGESILMRMEGACTLICFFSQPLGWAPR